MGKLHFPRGITLDGRLVLPRSPGLSRVASLVGIRGIAALRKVRIRIWGITVRRCLWSFGLVGNVGFAQGVDRIVWVLCQVSRMVIVMTRVCLASQKGALSFFLLVFVWSFVIPLVNTLGRVESKITMSTYSCLIMWRVPDAVVVVPRHLETSF